MTFHEGEKEMQRRAGVSAMAARVGRLIRNAIPEQAAGFLAGQRMLLSGSRDGAGRVRALLHTGLPGFARPPAPDRVEIDGESLLQGPAGLLAIDFESRQRMRVNGIAAPRAGGFEVRVAEFYPNCPKYIQARRFEGEVPLPPQPRPSSAALTPEQGRFIAASDTFFIATVPPGAPADASHRGGPAGFVRVLSPDRLAWDDYEGNAMFNTLGNVVLDPEVGLLFVDFNGGRTLHLNGRASVRGDRERIVEVSIDRVMEDPAGNPLRWCFVESSPFNPSCAGPGPR